MQKVLPFLAGLLIAGSGHALRAQSITHFYNEQHFARSIGNVPGYDDLYVTAETIDGATDQAIHVSFYQAPNMLINSFLIDEPGIDDQSVAVVPLKKNACLLAANARDVASNTVQTRLILVDPTNGNILQDQTFTSKDPNYNSIYALDAKYDAHLDQFVVCGMIFRNLDDARSDPKAACVFTADGHFNLINMRSYESVAPGQTADYDIANRIVLNSTGRYYISGSENAQKWIGNYYRQSIRNMLIDPFSLAPIWRQPFGLATDLHEMSLDMIEDPNGMFATVVNYDQARSWGLLRIDPGSGNSPTGFLETTGWPEYAHNVTSSSLGSNFAALTGMQWRTVNPCNSYDNQADPFFTLLDLGSIPATVVNRTEYLTQMGNDNGSTNYWTYGGFYSPQNGYPLSPYRNRIADRSFGNMHQVLAPVFDPSQSVLNTKFITTDEFGNTSCPTYNCSNALNTLTANPANATLWDYADKLDQNPSHLKSIVYDMYGKEECANGYYRESNGESPAATAAQPAMALRIYPNPTADVLQVQLPSGLEGTVRVELTDLSGRTVAAIYEGATTAAPIVYALPQHVAGGMYLVQISAPGRQPIQEKLTVIR